MNSKNAILHSPRFDQLASELAKVSRFLAERGWSPAMSSNYSAKIDHEHIAISRTGVNKFVMTPQDVIVIDRAGEVVAPAAARSSAETLIHTTIYEALPGVEAVLHTHSPENTRLSLRYKDMGQITFEGYEMQKGLYGNETHETLTLIPILPNAQDMKAYAKDVSHLLQKHKNIHGFLIAGHGLYTWGENLTITQRQVETFEFLFRCRALELMGV